MNVYRKEWKPAAPTIAYAIAVVGSNAENDCGGFFTKTVSRASWTTRGYAREKSDWGLALRIDEEGQVKRCRKITAVRQIAAHIETPSRESK